jgi:hypothetical protein
VFAKVRQQNILHAFIGLVVAVAAGCASNVAETRQPRGVGVWNFRLPSTPSAVAGLAYGRGGNATPAPAESSPLLAAKTAPENAKPVEHARVVVHHRATSVEPLPSLPVVDAAPIAPPVAKTEPVQLAQADTKLADRYGQREAESRTLERFKGGDVVVIGITSGALVIVLLVVLLILLLR